MEFTYIKSIFYVITSTLEYQNRKLTLEKNFILLTYFIQNIILKSLLETLLPGLCLFNFDFSPSFQYTVTGHNLKISG